MNDTTQSEFNSHNRRIESGDYEFPNPEDFAAINKRLAVLLAEHAKVLLNTEFGFGVVTFEGTAGLEDLFNDATFEILQRAQFERDFL